ncbi:MAG: hypothetical protein AB7D40_05860 [Bacteroidales bacterium]
MKTYFTVHILFLLCVVCLSTMHAATDSSSGPALREAHVQRFMEQYPQEKVYLHFDNTTYILGDTIWYACYVTHATEQTATSISRVLYVELLSPEGIVVDSRKLNIVDGRCHGEFVLDVGYSGYYEVRAFTRYMLNWGRDWTFSRIFPVFDQPEVEGDYSHLEMTGYQHRFELIPEREPSSETLKKVNVTFYPEGGQLVQGLPSRLAFKATDETGRGIDVQAMVEHAGHQRDTVSSLHHGMGVLSYTPERSKEYITILYRGKKHRFDLPEASVEGYVMQVDNSREDSLSIQLRQSAGLRPQVLGLSILSRGRLTVWRTLSVGARSDERNRVGDAILVQLSKKDLLPGVNQLTLFDVKGQVLLERLFFVDVPDSDAASILLENPALTYKPKEPIRLDFKSQPNSLFSLSVRDKAADRMDWTDDIRTHLLLSSEVKGFIEDPGYYFENTGKHKSKDRRAALDLLLMVQGWRRYDWQVMASDSLFTLAHKPEVGLELEGRIVPDMNRAKFEEGANKKSKRGKEEPPLVPLLPSQYMDSLRLYLDDLDRLSKGLPYRLQVKCDENAAFRMLWDDFNGDQSIRLSLQNINHPMSDAYTKRFRILLDRAFSPAPRPYRTVETQLVKPALQREKTIAVVGEKNDITKIQIIPEVTIQGTNREQTYVVYDVEREKTRLRDQGLFYPETFIEYLKSKGIPIKRRNRRGTESLGSSAHFYLDLDTKIEYKYFTHGTELLLCFRPLEMREQLGGRQFDAFPLNEIQKVFLYDNDRAHLQVVNFYLASKRHFIHNAFQVATMKLYPPSDFIDRQDDPHIRTTKLEGFSVPKSFYSGMNPLLPGDVDYRRTLYWNPTVRTDSVGRASVQFYNNSVCREILLNAEGLREDGVPLVLDRSFDD